MKTSLLSRTLFQLFSIGVIPLLLNNAAFAAATPGRYLDNTPPVIQTASDLGPVNPARIIDITLWLSLRNHEALDTLAQQQYQNGSPEYHKWVQHTDISARFEPALSDIQAVQMFLTRQNLSPTLAGPDNLFVRARGTVADVSRAFQIGIHQYQIPAGTPFRSNSSDPFLPAAIANIVQSISGLDDFTLKAHLVKRDVLTPSDLPLPSPGRPHGPAAADSAFFRSTCFTGTATESLAEPAPASVFASFTGLKYYTSLTDPGCGYTPQQVRAAYGLDALYAAGQDGTGQTIVLLESCGSETILQDANEFAQRFGLPPFTASNFKTLSYPFPSTCASRNEQLTADVEWAHAIAPGAAITVLATPSASIQDFEAAEVYALDARLGPVLSLGSGLDEPYFSPALSTTIADIDELAAASGIAVNASTGVLGDSSVRPVGAPGPATVSVPASTPWVTAVGGVSTALNSNSTISWQTGWGTNVVSLFDYGIIDGPYGNLRAGSGGGASHVFAKPTFQSAIPGDFRSIPDIAWLADPLLGPVIAISNSRTFPIEYESVGGTGVACSMFSALWAIANQEAGGWLGQAAAALYAMPAATISDVLPQTSPNNVTGFERLSGGVVIQYTASYLGLSDAASQSQRLFISALYDSPFKVDATYLVTFGTDGRLQLGPGWDNVTGLGTPNAKAFADYFNPAR